MISLIDPATASLFAKTTVGLAIGFVLGLVHFRMLWQTTRLLVAGGAVARTVALQFLRLGLIVGGLALLAWAGTLPLIAATIGLSGARQVVVRRFGARL